MKTFEIKRWQDGTIIASEEAETLKEAIQKLIKNNANLSYADLRSADLRYANLSSADLRYANLSSADLRYANLSSADLRYANLRYANLSYANLSYANLSSADLRSADLRYANLSSADLSYADIEFYLFPSIRLLSSMELGELPDSITLELMRRDAYAHPHPKKFDKWAKNGECPYQNEERFWLFEIKKELWRKGKPQMRDSDLILEICKAKGWVIKGYLKIPKAKK